MEIKFDEKDVTGRSKLEAVAKAWGFVQEENKAHKKYVTTQVWQNWVEYDDVTSKALENVIENYNGYNLDSSSDARLDAIIVSVGGSTRKSEKEFIDEIRQNALAKNQEEAARKNRNENQKELKSFKSNLKGMFGLK